jgi:hypothetical protein
VIRNRKERRFINVKGEEGKERETTDRKEIICLESKARTKGKL